jgi:hypothetical protein
MTAPQPTVAKGKAMTGITQTNGERRGVSWRILGWGGAAALLAVPAVAMRFTNEVNWSPGDFIFAAMLFGLVGLTLELAVRSSRDWAWRGGIALMALSCLLLVWANGAVGMIGNEDTSYNLLFLGLIPLAIVGGAIVRFRAAGMVWVLLGAAGAQIAIAAAGASVDPRGAVFSTLLSGFWLLGALLFRLAARRAAGDGYR